MQQQQALPANNPPAPATMHTRESKPHPPQTQIAQWVAAPQQGPVVNLVFQLAVPADQLMRTGAFQLFAPRLSFQVPNHQGQAFHPQPSTQAATLRFHKPPSHSFAHPTPTASPTPLRKLEPALGTPPSPPPPLPSITTGTPTPPVTPNHQKHTPIHNAAPPPNDHHRTQAHHTSSPKPRRRPVPAQPPPAAGCAPRRDAATITTWMDGAAASEGRIRTSRHRRRRRRRRKTVPGAFSVEALCGQAVSQHHPE
ncbi:hypothetical protein DFJ73DRAFT_792140 [Zopfochytrium polystomum]|nr:hypothetical protein DFJ73DRAFT_792140 [Zopfochytrium polystomum]